MEMIGDAGDGNLGSEESRRNHFEDDRLTEVVIAALIRVHKALGPGFLENIYHRALTVDFRKHQIPFVTEHEIEIRYEGELVGRHRLDLVVGRQLIVELKAIEELHKAHYSQLRSYLKAAGLRVGLLVNFAKDKADYRRVEV